MEKKFSEQSTNINNVKWKNMIKREMPLYQRKNEIRSTFERDYTRIIHSNAYRRQKHKTQVFFCPQNDHVCTRIEHVNYVESISCSIAQYLGLNVELTRAIAVAHDLGHAPFGHKGESILSKISMRDIGEIFWHEKNGVNLVDNIELLEDEERNMQNLNLTYAVRDGIISHCGEIDENALKPREEAIDLEMYKRPNQYAPYTWEGCVVKVSDKISYICRDIEDAIRLKIVKEEQIKELLKITKTQYINNTRIIHNLSDDLCFNSTPENGLILSRENYDILNAIKKFNYENIYLNEKLMPSDRYFNLVINEIYEFLKKLYNGEKTIQELEKVQELYPELTSGFIDWLNEYSDINTNRQNLKNKIIYHMCDEKDYFKSILHFISGMTDNYAMKIYNEIISF